MGKETKPETDEEAAQGHQHQNQRLQKVTQVPESYKQNENISTLLSDDLHGNAFKRQVC